MHMEPIESEAIIAVGYDENTRILRVTFRNDRTYEYLDVPPEEYVRFMNAESRGAWMNQVIKLEYECREVEA
jgi:hypothetical protein